MLVSCISPEVRQRQAELQAIAASEIESKIPSMAIAFEKACVPYLKEVLIEQIMTERFAQERGKKLKKALGGSDYHIGVQISPEYKFRIPCFPNQSH